MADTVQGLICAAATDGLHGEVINLGVGKGIAIGVLSTRIMELMETRVPVEAVPARTRPEGSEGLTPVSDNRKAARMLGWAPTTPLDEGLRRVIDFVRESPHLYRPTDYAV